ncbi:hypothetical protein IAE35_15840 [Pseudomonas sp. S75]|uniref:hypothetical protein n=1 Tax=unclassified Pseudomonas TaxID=196821 RepID=UPI00190733F9|nr:MULTISPECIES: hypothetical protein [unclassified Pseudomonas]MBJ9977372.1 hypothetical protein [Pseudomonas sp. S30]MBK0154816.1 hypothetical protein [Pseudomonas sp. S75]
MYQFVTKRSGVPDLNAGSTWQMFQSLPPALKQKEYLATPPPALFYTSAQREFGYINLHFTFF